MIIKRGKIFGILLVFTFFSLSMSSFAAVQAKDLGFPEGVVVTYYTGANVEVSLPSRLTIPSPAGVYTVDAIDLRFVHVEAATVASGDYVFVHLITHNPSFPTVPWAVLMTSTDVAFASFWKTMLVGSPVYIPGTFNNVYSVPGALTVERHGNSITASLATDQPIKIIPGANPVYFTLPAFTLQLDKIDGSVHDYLSQTLTGYPGASGYVETRTRMGFVGVGTFTCNAWNPSSRPVSNGFVVMNGLLTYTPPS